MSARRLPDRCERCGRFVGYYPVGFYDDRYCRPCYDDTREPEPPSYFMRDEDGYARYMAWQAGERSAA
jgi:hypothetical protein